MSTAVHEAAPDAADPAVETEPVQAAPQPASSAPRKPPKHQRLILAVGLGGLLLFVVLAAISLKHA